MDSMEGIIMEYTDEQIKELWTEFEDVPIDYDDGDAYLANDWFIFQKGEDLWTVYRWFDRNYSKGISGLLY